MGRSKGKTWSDAPKAAVARRKGLAATVADDFVVSDSDEERNDVSNRRPDKISLNKADDFRDESDDGMNEEEVMGLSEDEDDDDEDDELEEDDDEDDDDDEQAMIEKMIARGGRSAELAKQAKMIGAKLKLQQKEHDEEDEEEEDDQQDGGWGANKKRYYDADTAGLEGSDAEAALQEEEEEVARLEQLKAGRMRASDFGLDDDEEEEEEEGESDEDDEAAAEETMAALAKSKKAKGSKAVARGVEVEAVAKQLDALTAEERGSALMADAPELLVLLQDLTESLTEVRQRVGPVLQEVRSGGLATTEGISYLEAKYLLLLQYCSHIVFYILLKAEGRPVKDHPVIARLVELRAYLEKIRPIDKRLQYQIERLIKAAQIAAKEQQPAAKGSTAAEAGTAAAAAAAGGEDLQAADIDADALHFGPRRDQLAGPANGAAAAGASKAAAAPSGVYRPPKINPVSMEGDVDRRVLSRDESRLLKEARRKAARSELVRELAEDVAGAPRELRTEVPGFDSLAAVKQRQRLEARAAVEEDMMSRVPLSKEEAKKMRQQQRAGMSGKSMLDDFADEVADIVGMSQGPDGGKGSRLADLFSRQKVSQKFGAEPARLAAHGGDEDLPRREALHERRSKYDAVTARRSAAAADGFDDDDGDGPDSEYFGGGGRGGKAGKRRGGEEDDLYQEAKVSAQERKRARQDKFASPAMHPPLPDEPAAGARGITTAIEKNRGLTPHRRKDLKNPRKKHRLMFEKATMRHKGAVQGVRSPTATYGGEATGLKSRVVKSRKIG